MCEEQLRGSYVIAGTHTDVFKDVELGCVWVHCDTS